MTTRNEKKRTENQLRNANWISNVLVSFETYTFFLVFLLQCFSTAGKHQYCPWCTSTVVCIMIRSMHCY